MTDHTPSRRNCGNCACFQGLEAAVPGGPDGFCYLNPPAVTEAERQSSRIATAASPNPTPMRGTLTYRPPVRRVGVCFRWRPLGCLPGETAGEYALRVSLAAFSVDLSNPEAALRRMIAAYQSAAAGTVDAGATKN